MKRWFKGFQKRSVSVRIVMEMWLSVREGGEFKEEMELRLRLMERGYRIASKEESEYPIHKSIREGSFMELV